MIHFTCPACNANQAVSDHFGGRTISCPRCKRPVTLPIVTAISPGAAISHAAAPPPLARPQSNIVQKQSNKGLVALCLAVVGVFLACLSFCVSTGLFGPAFIICAFLFGPCLIAAWIIGRQALRENPKDQAAKQAAKLAVSICWVAGVCVCAIISAALVGLIYAMVIHG